MCCAICEILYRRRSARIAGGKTCGIGAIVGYAVTSDGIARSGVLRRWDKRVDSDRTAGVFTGQAQPNHAVAFELAVP